MQLQTALQASELERGRQAAELDVLMTHLPATSLQHGSDTVSGHNGHKVRRLHRILGWARDAVD